MDIWSWVRELRGDLAERGEPAVLAAWDRFMDACDNKQEVALTLAPALVADAERLDLPWMAVLVRHWVLQLRILDRNEGATVLADAVDALERAHRPETAACPQSVCTTQDLSLAYEAVDRVGWAPDRLAVVDEAIAGIDASWACWECLAAERSSALEDLGRLDEARDVLDRLGAERRFAGAVPTAHHQRIAAAHYVRLGRAQQALDIIDEVGDGATNEPERFGVRLTRIEALVELGRLADSDEVFTGEGDTFGELLAHGYRLRWTRLAARLIEAGALPNDALVGWRMSRAAVELADLGSYRDAYDLAEIHHELSVARGAGWSARTAAALARRASDGLRFPDTVAERLAEMDAAAAAVPPRPTPVDPEQLAAYLDGETGVDADPESVVEWLEAAVAARPEDLELVGRWARHVAALGGQDRAFDELAARLVVDPASEELAEIMLGLAAGLGAAARLDELATVVEADQPALAAWARALGAHRRGDLDACRARCAEVLALDPEALNTRRLAAAAAREAGDPADAVALLRQVCERTDPGGDDWTLLEVATIAGDWATVRWAARRLGLPVDDPADGDESTPIDELWSYVAVRPLGGAPDGDDDLFAVRTGPVTARILTVTRRGRQRTRDVVVFDAAPLEPPPSDDAEWTPTFAEVHVLSEGGWRAWELFGERPDDDRWAAFVGGVRDAGHELWAMSPPTAEIVDDDGDVRRGVFALVAAAPEVTPAQLRSDLMDLTAGWAERLVHPDLDDDAGAPSDAAWDFWNTNRWA